MMQAKNKFLPFLIAPAVLASFVATPVAAYPTKPTNLQSMAPPSSWVATRGWKEFSQENFSISFPGDPSKDEKKIDKERVAQIFTVESDEGYYLLSQLEMPSETGELPDAFKQLVLDIAVEAMLPDSSAKVSDKQNISLNGHPGVEFSFTYGKVFAGKGRMYIVGDQAYLLMSVTTDESNSQKFFESFKLI